MLQAFIGNFWRLVEIAIALAMITLMGLVFVNVVLRYGFDSGILFSPEASRFIFAWLVMLGAAVCLRNESHLDLRTLDDRLPVRLRQILRRAVYAVIALSSGMLCLGSARQTVENWSNISPMSGIPVGVLYLAGAFGGAVMVVIAAIRVLRPLKSTHAESSDQA